MLEGAEAEEFRRSLLELFEDLEELTVFAWLRDQPTTLGASAQDLAGPLHLPLRNVQEALERLVDRALISRSSAPPATYCYVIRDAELDARLARIIHEFKSNPVQVLGFMTSNSIERLRTETLRTFADAFRLGRRKPDG